jgi:hypothetical protein
MLARDLGDTELEHAAFHNLARNRDRAIAGRLETFGAAVACWANDAFITLTSWLPAIVGMLTMAFASRANQESAGAYVFVVTLTLWPVMLGTMLFWAVALGIAGLQRFWWRRG